MRAILLRRYALVYTTGTRDEGVKMNRIALVLLLAAGQTLTQTATAHRITHTYTLGGDGGWDSSAAAFCRAYGRVRQKVT